MKLKGKTWKAGKPVIRNTLYEIRGDRVFPFEEVHEDDSKDTVSVDFKINESQKGFYAEEYRPPFVDEDGCKKTDILAMIVEFKFYSETYLYVVHILKKQKAEQYHYDLQCNLS